MIENASTPPAGQPDEHTVRVQQLFVRHQSAIKAFILSLQPDFAEAEDVLQEAFLTVTRKAGEFVEGSNFIAWAFAIARFKLLEARRRRAKAGAFSDELLEALAAVAPDEAFFETRLMALRRCLERLAPRAQEIVRLRYHGERRPEEIARLLAWTPNAVNVALSKARGWLRDCVRRQLGAAS
ncbi:MAG: sigma-70 family RNA polymerase sigma factor [Verrucomicrobia bacterium]|nr:sigma-70 family RNA polymerase sigma factor [Verrucomicrobiota bacterium]